METRKIIYLLLAIVIAIPYIRPIGIPVATSKMTRDFYNKLESLPEDSVVVLMIDVGIGSWVELGPSSVAVIQHLLDLPIKLIVSGGSTEVYPYWEYAVDMGNINFRDNVYGEDYVILGFITGGEPAVAAFADNLHITSQDQYGTPVEEIPMMKDLRTAADVSVILSIMAGTQEEYYLRQWQAPYGTEHGIVVSAVTTMLAMTYYVSGQLFGMVNSLRGGAEYELLIQRPGKGVVGTDMLSMALLFEIALLIVGNISMVYNRSKVKKTIVKEGEDIK